MVLLGENIRGEGLIQGVTMRNKKDRALGLCLSCLRLPLWLTFLTSKGSDHPPVILAAKVISHVAAHFIIQRCLRQLAGQLQSIPPVIVSEREVGIDPNGGVAILQRLFELALIRIGSCPIGEGHFVLGIESNGAGGRCDGPIPVSPA